MPAWTQDYHDTFQPISTISGPRFEPGAFRIRSANGKHSTAKFGYSDYSGFGFRQGQEVSLFSTSDLLSSTLSPLSNGYRALSPGIKGVGREANPSPITSVEVKNTWITLAYVFAS